MLKSVVFDIMTTWQDLLEKFCLACNLEYRFIKRCRSMDREKYPMFMLTFEDLTGSNPILCGTTDKAETSLKKYRRYYGDFLGNTEEETAKLFFEAFLMPNVYLYANDSEAWDAAKDLKDFSGNSLESLEVKLDLMTMDKVKSSLTTDEKQEKNALCDDKDI